MIKVAGFKIRFLWSVGSSPTTRTIDIFLNKHAQARSI